jgi:hypothetical protein
MGATSLKPSKQEKGGLLDDADVTLQTVRFVLWDYQGAIDTPVPALFAEMVTDDGASFNQYYSAGDAKHLEPSEDGLRLLNKPGSKREGLNDNTNAAAFLASIVSAGFPEDQIDETVDVFDGLKCHVNRVAQKERKGLINPAQADGSKRQSTVLLVSSIISLPGETKKVAGKKGAAPAAAVKGKPVAAAAAPAKSAGTELYEEADELIVGLLTEDRYAESGVPKARLSVEALKALKGNANSRAIMGFITKDEYLTSEDRPFAYDGTSLTAPE